MSAIRFFHMADLHLDSPFKGLFGLPEHNFKKIRTSTFEAFNTIIDEYQKSPSIGSRFLKRNLNHNYEAAEQRAFLVLCAAASLNFPGIIII